MCLTSAWLKTVLLCVGASQLSVRLAGLAGALAVLGLLAMGPPLLLGLLAMGLLLAVGLPPLPAPAETAKQQAARASSWSTIAAGHCLAPLASAWPAACWRSSRSPQPPGAPKMTTAEVAACTQGGSEGPASTACGQGRAACGEGCANSSARGGPAARSRSCAPRESHRGCRWHCRSCCNGAYSACGPGA